MPSQRESLSERLRFSWLLLLCVVAVICLSVSVGGLLGIATMMMIVVPGVIIAVFSVMTFVTVIVIAMSVIPMVSVAVMRLVKRLGFLPIVFLAGPNGQRKPHGDTGSENLAMHAVP